MANRPSILSPVWVTLTYISIFLVIPRVNALGASTDTYTWGGDYLRNGYQTNHNMDPSVVGSANFGQIFQTALPGNFNGIGPEQIFSQPLVFTGNDGVQYVYLATTQNNIYKLNAKTGAIVESRNMHVPFLTADLDGCVDINPTVGVTATGTIDPDTGIWYLLAKTYAPQFQNGQFGPSTPPGRLNGRYYFHGIDTQSGNLTDVFPPVLLDGRLFRNNPNRMFIGGNQHARPGLVLAGQYVYTGYASHCVQYNVTGAIIGHDKTTGQVVEIFAMEGGPEPNTVKGGGVWMSGGGISYDGSSLFFTTGNGYASQLSGTSIPGRQPPTALEEATVNAKVNADGTISILDFFMPWEKVQLDGADKDLGTTPLEILPTGVFTCPNVKRMGVVTGKSGKTYVLNLDNLGGYQMGANKLDNVVFVYQNENSVYAGAGVMPLGGGYIYINIIKYQTRVFKFSCDGSGTPQFTVVANTAEFNAAILGTGHGTTTSLNGQDGTGLYWISDVEGLNLRIYNAIPPSSGTSLTLINSFNIPAVTKFTRPVFGDGRVFIGTTSGFFYGFGSPVNLPLNCSSPYSFGKVSLKNSSAPTTITCVAQVGITVTGISLSGNANFKLSNLPASKLVLAPAGSFSFQAVFNPQSVGPLSSDVIVNTTNSVAGYSINTPITLIGTANSAAPLLKIGPNTVSFNIIAGQQTGGVNESSIFSNAGDTTLNIQNISYSLQSETGPWVTPNITSAGLQVGPFTFYSVPKTIPSHGQVTIAINYNPTAAGNDACFMSVASDGGTVLLDIVAVAGTYPSALIEFEKYDGSGWTKLNSLSVFTFGNVTENQTRNLRLRVTNNGTGNAVPLSLTVSKPPYGVPGIVGAVNNVDLAEGTLLAAGQSATATLYCSVPKSQVNVASYQGSANWTMNTGDPVLGKQFMEFTCTAVAEQIGPLFNNGSAQYGYVGCYRENNPSRQLAVNIYSSSTANTNGKCISACAAAGWLYAATQYQQECWCGNAIPVELDLERDCNYACTGNGNQICGGNGYFTDGPRMSLFADLTRYKNVISPPLSIPQSVNGHNYVGCYAEKGGKVLSLIATTDTTSMTVEKCSTYCGAYPYFSLEYAQECYCGNAINTNFATLTSDSFCQTMTCKGNNSEYCGAGNYGQVYALNGTKPSISSSSAASTTSSLTSALAAAATTSAPTLSLSNYTYMGCYNETHDRRALTLKQGGGSTNTLNSCAAFCLGYNYFGVEYSAECYCANDIYVNSIKQPTEVGCSMSCAGNSSQTCGGPDFLTIYYINATAASPSSTTTAASTPIGTEDPTTVASIGPYNYLGCYNEIGGRALSGSTVANSSMAVELCANYCSAFTYFSVEYSQECYCGNSIGSGSAASSTGACTMTCAGNPKEYCGGASWMDLYQKNGTAASATVSGATSSGSVTSSSTGVPSRIDSYVSLGCYTDNVAGRALANVYADDTMTLELCANQASAATAQYFGVEYGRECWFGSSIVGSNAPSDQSKCNMQCPGNAFERCGAGNQLQMYNFTTAASLSSSVLSSSTVGSFSSLASRSSSSSLSLSSRSFARISSSTSPSSSVIVGSTTFSGSLSSRATSSLLLSSSVLLSSGISFTSAGPSISRLSSATVSSSFGSLSSRSASSSPSSSIQSSSALSSSSSFSVSSNRILSSGSSTPQSGFSSSSTRLSSSPDLPTSSSMPSSKSSSTISSASSILSSSGSRSSSSSIKSSSISATRSRTGSSTRTTSSATTPTAVPTISSYNYKGCYNETSGRTFTALSITNDTGMTIGMCASYCSNYAWFGVEYRTQCYCGPYPRPGSGPVPDQKDCNMPCVGDKSQLCGAGDRLTTYFSTDPDKIYADPASPAKVQSYAYYNCIVDSPRMFSSVSKSDSLTVENCIAIAQAGGYRYAGLEYGRECWFGNSLHSPIANASTGACNMACKGNGKQLCGAVSRMSLYVKTG